MEPRVLIDAINRRRNITPLPMGVLINRVPDSAATPIAPLMN